MKTIKLSIIALVVAFSVQVADAQVRVGVNIGTPPPRTVIVERRAPVVYRHRPVIYRRPVVYRRHYVPMRHRVVYARPHYRRW